MSNPAASRHWIQVSVLLTIAAVGTVVWLLWIRSTRPIESVMHLSGLGWGYLALTLCFHFWNSRHTRSR